MVGNTPFVIHQLCFSFVIISMTCKITSHQFIFSDNDINRLNSENLALTSEVAKLTNQTSSLERDKLKMGEQSRRNEQQIQDLQEQINEK